MKIELLPPLPYGSPQPDPDPAPPEGRDVVILAPAQPPVPAPDGLPAEEGGDTAEETGPRSPLQDLLAGRTVREMTPRQMAEFSLDLYAANYLDWTEYSMLAFQPELHPDYDRTVGALTGDPARPDLPRDFIADWEKRLDFELRHRQQDPATLDRVEHIVTVLRLTERPMNVMA